MRKIGTKILRILDGVPAVQGQPSRGQSVVELALVTPILIVLLMGLAEIGWFANNYLILMEASRVGARLGTGQTGDVVPLKWDNDASLSPQFFGVGAVPPEASQYRNCSDVDNDPSIRRFYNYIACKMLSAMEPLTFKGFGTEANAEDDIVISAFALQKVLPNDTTDDMPTSMSSVIDGAPGYTGNQSQVVVVGRYPTNANECTSDGTDNSRDPFDYIHNTTRDAIALDPLQPIGPDNILYFELDGYDTAAERQRGFSFTGQHDVVGTSCIGSEWTINEVENLVNLATYSLNDTPRVALPSQGMIMVEVFWQHELLLKNPVFNPVFVILGNQTTISVWSAFPLPSVEPKIRYSRAS
jgi:hypothetical protein